MRDGRIFRVPNFKICCIIVLSYYVAGKDQDKEN